MLEILQEGESLISKLQKVETKETDWKLGPERKKGIQQCPKYQVNR